jgi:hydroxymethylglutaryl-CoA synthase
MTKTSIGLVSYGYDLPIYRISVDEIAQAWGNDAEAYKRGLGLIEKTVPGLDEDTITLATNSALVAYERSNKPSIGAVYVGSESHPYAVKPSSGIVGQALGIENNYTAADLEFACKAGSAGLQMVLSHVKAGVMDAGIAIGADTSQGAPGDALEFSAAAGSAAFLVGKERIIAELIHTASITSDTPDFWRREHQNFPKHGGRFTGEPAYFEHIVGATKLLLSESKMNIEDFDHVVFHMPNGKFPKAVAKSLNCDEKQMRAGFVVPFIGNTYSACALLGFTSVLDIALPGEKILVTSYGSGAGSDSFAFEITDEIIKYREGIERSKTDEFLSDKIERKHYLNYGQYVRHTHKLKS